ncbi:MAG: hypothetical protein K2V38_26585, partial [Gemmataceae bacterium]|nr:hypothetical protein [Gemmataceae bacterium]
MAKPKFNPKDFLLQRGELVLMAGAGLCLVVLLLWGASKWASAENPDKIARDLAMKSDEVKKKIETEKPTAEQLEEIKPPAIILEPSRNTPATTDAFPLSGPVFDPTAQPSLKRENPFVLGIGDYQAD